MIFKCLVTDQDLEEFLDTHLESSWKVNLRGKKINSQGNLELNFTVD